MANNNQNAHIRIRTKPQVVNIAGRSELYKKAKKDAEILSAEYLKKLENAGMQAATAGAKAREVLIKLARQYL